MIKKTLLSPGLLAVLAWLGSSQQALAEPMRHLSGTPQQPDFSAQYGGGGTDPGGGVTPPPPVATPGQLTFGASSYNVPEDAGSLNVTVVRSGGDNGAVSLGYATAAGSALAGEDYISAQGSLSWADGETGAKSFTIQIVDNARKEEDKNFLVLLENVSGGASLNQAQATVTIINDDTQTTAELLGSVAKNPTQAAMAEAIAAIYDSGMASPELQGLFEQLLNNVHNDPNGVANALQQIAPEEYHAQGRLSIEGVSTQQRNLESRLYALRRGSRCLDLSGANVKVNDEIIDNHAFNTPESKCAGGGWNGNQRWGLFLNGDMAMGERDVTDREAGFEFDSQGLTLGADYRLSGRAIIGAAAGYMRTDADFADNGGSLETDGYSLSLYGMYYETDKYYLDAIYTYGNNSFDNERAVRYTLDGLDVNQLAVSDNDSTQHAFSLGMGHHFHHGNFVSTPNVHFDYSRVSLDPLEEQMSDPDARGAALALAVDDMEIESSRMRLGWNFSYNFRQGWGVLVPYFSAHAIYDFNNDYRDLTGRFLYDQSGEKFAIRSDRPDRAYWQLGLGLLAEFAPGRMAYLMYETLEGMEDFERDAVTAGLRYEF